MYPHIQLHLNYTSLPLSPHSVQKQAIVKLKEEEEKRRQKSSRHAEAIRTQVKEQELSAVAKRRELFKESERLMEEDRQRRVRLEEIKEKKLQELKSVQRPESAFWGFSLCCSSICFVHVVRPW